MPLYCNQGIVLTSAVDARFLLQMRDAAVASYWRWRNVAGGVGAFAGDGVGKWAAVAVAATHWDVCRCLFSVTRPIGVDRKNVVEQSAEDQTKRCPRSNAVSYR